MGTGLCVRGGFIYLHIDMGFGRVSYGNGRDKFGQKKKISLIYKRNILIVSYESIFKSKGYIYILLRVKEKLK